MNQVLMRGFVLLVLDTLPLEKNIIDSKENKFLLLILYNEIDLKSEKKNNNNNE